MAALRFVAGLLLLVAVIALVSDATRLQLGLPGPPSTPLAKHLSDFAPSTLTVAQRTVQTKVHPLVWNPLLKSFLSLPTWASLGTMGLLLAYFGRRRQRIKIYAN
jgi:hypothetical protein